MPLLADFKRLTPAIRRALATVWRVIEVFATLITIVSLIRDLIK
jgi:hypothetical protein